ncbi:MAG: DUF4919 domain-containing protein [Bacteroidaceae bacterium]|nr:DUF4919 domain-containing protein [Bacteroidaceae bacterium]
MRLRIYIIVLSALLATVLCGKARAQSEEDATMVLPDMEQIRAEVNNPQSRYYYPTLMAKYYSPDTTMTLEEYRYYYLGYTFQEDYNPYRKSEFAHQIDHLYKQGRKLSIAEYENLIKFAQQTLNDDPFDLRQINILIYALKGVNRYKEASVWQYRLDHLIDAIVSTGDGLTPETAWYVIYPTHEYIVLNCLGMKGVDYVFVAPGYDYIEIEENNRRIEGFYFNVERILDVYDTKYCHEDGPETEY